MSDIKPRASTRSRPSLSRLARWETVTVFLLIASILYGTSTSEDFFTGGNLNSILSDIVEIAIIALPLTLIIVAAEIDLSVASVARPHQRPDGLPVEPRLGDGDDHPGGPRRRRRSRARSTACWSRASGSRRWR